MTFVFENGTDQQVEWFNEAVTRCLFPFERITSTVHVLWVDQVPVGHNLAAYTIWGSTPADDCGRPDLATIEITNTLDHPDGVPGYGPRGYFGGKRFYMETVIHELGHVVQSKFSTEQIAELCSIFGGIPAMWSDPPKWEEKLQESFTETLKDLYLPRPYRKFNNRTHHRLPDERALERFYAVLDHVCPCEGSIIIT